MKTIYILDAYKKIGTKLFYLTWRRKRKFKTNHKKNEKKVNLKVLGVNP